MVEKTLKMPK